MCIRPTSNVHFKNVSVVIVKGLAIGVALFLLLLSGCARLPDYGRPHLNRGVKLPLNVVSYRDLTISDFLADNVPDRLKEHAKKLNAHTAVSIRPVPGTNYTISTTHINNQKVYYGQVEKLSFEAVMIPEHSWWNPAMAMIRKDYVLQHEQIHFALMEVAARRLTKKAEEESELLKVYESSFDSAKEKLLNIYSIWLEESRAKVLKEHTSFDEDTSLIYAPKIQQRWYDRVKTDLNNLEKWD